MGILPFASKVLETHFLFSLLFFIVFSLCFSVYYKVKNNSCPQGSVRRGSSCSTILKRAGEESLWLWDFSVHEMHHTEPLNYHCSTKSTNFNFVKQLKSATPLLLWVFNDNFYSKCSLCQSQYKLQHSWECSGKNFCSMFLLQKSSMTWISDSHLWP